MNIHRAKLLLVLLALFAFHAPKTKAATSPTPSFFFTPQTTLGTLSDGDPVYYLDYFKSYTYSGSTPTIVYKFNFGFLYFLGPKSGNLSSSDAYFYDYTTGDYFYTSAGLYPYFYSFNLSSFLYYFENSSPREFYEFKTSSFVAY